MSRPEDTAPDPELWVEWLVVEAVFEVAGAQILEPALPTSSWSGPMRRGGLLVETATGPVPCEGEVGPARFRLRDGTSRWLVLTRLVSGEPSGVQPGCRVWIPRAWRPDRDARAT